MSYNRGTLGYEPWGVTNPWVFANYGQPQRKRGYVSPMVFQTHGPYLQSAHLGAPPDTAMEDWWEREGKHLSFDQLTQRYGPGDAEFEFWMGGAGIEKSKSAMELRRAERMEKIAIAGLALSTASLWLGYQFYRERKVAANRRKRRRRRPRRRRKRTSR